MIEETLLKSNYLGKDGFIWWLGQVAPPKVWDIPEKIDINSKEFPTSWAYRCKVRIIGYHTFDRNILPDNDLPWAHIMLGNTDGNAQGGLGKTHKLVGGETVFGFFLDGDDAQQPVVIGTLYKNHNVKNFNIDEIAFKPFSGANSPGTRIRVGETKQAEISSTLSSPPQQPPGDEEESDIIGGIMKDPITSNFTYSAETDKFFPFDQAMNIAYTRASEPTIVSENGCDNNAIGKITREIKNFISVVSGLEKSLNLYVNPTLNSFVDITQEIKRTASIIAGSIKFLINNMRNMIMKMVGCLFSKFVGLIIPIPQQPIVGEATKNILNVIFCLFEKIIDQFLPFLEEMLKGLVGRATSAPLCAVEEFTASTMNNVIDTIDELLAPVLSGLDWLMSGVSQVSSLLSQSNSIATQVFNLIGCDNLKCQTPSEWSLATGPTKSEYDNWNRVVEKMNSLRTFNPDLNKGINGLSLYGRNPNVFSDCAERVRNPKSQDDLPNSTKRGSKCLPPEVKIYGGGGVGAEALAVVGKNGSILSVEILNQGFGYKKPPKIKIIDRTNYGAGASAKSTIVDGKLSRIYLTSPGFGYCRTNLDRIARKPLYLISSDRYSIYEGESFKFTITTQNVPDGTKLTYRIGGSVSQEDLDTPIVGTFQIFDGKSEIIVETKQDNVRELIEELFFDILDPEKNVVARAITIINDRMSPVLQIPREEKSQSPLGTTLPDGDFILSDVKLVLPPSPTPSSFNDEDILTASPSATGITTSTSPPSGAIVDIIIIKPGIGYTSGDTINIGGCSFTPILSRFGSIVGVENEDGCPNTFETIPEYFIDTNTGIGAEITPVLSFIQPTNIQATINQFGVIRVVDCI